MMKKTPLFLLGGSLLVNLVLIFLFFNSSPLYKEKAQDLPYLSPRIFLERQNDILINFVPLRQNLQDYVSGLKNKTGLYFEYLPSGLSIGINENDPYVLASLLKVPLVMGVYRNIADGKLSKNGTFEIKSENINKEFGSMWKKGVGEKVSVEDLINATIIDSDNTAKSVLFNNLQGPEIENVFDELDIPKERSNKEASVTPKNYSSVLKSLYLSSYLPKKYSNELLDLMTRTKFHDKLPAGVPGYIKVAHKIGVYIDPENKELPTYSDCGIIYYPKRPYLLCIMAKGPETEATQSMATLSKMVYNYIDKIE